MHIQVDHNLANVFTDALTWIIQNAPLIAAAIYSLWRVLKPAGSNNVDVLVQKEVLKREPVMTNGNGAAVTRLALNTDEDLRSFMKRFDAFMLADVLWKQDEFGKWRSEVNGKLEYLRGRSDRHEAALFPPKPQAAEPENIVT